MTSFSTGTSEWLGFFGPSGEQDGSPSKETAATSRSDESGIDWPLDDIMNDIEQQMNEQTDAMVGMTKQIEDIEGALAQHGSSSSRSKRIVKKKNSSYVQMSDDEDSLGGDLDSQPLASHNKGSILRVLQKKACLVGRRNSHDEDDDSQHKDRPLSRADAGSRYDLEVATVASSSTRRASNSSRRSAQNARSKLTPPHETQHSRRHLKLHPTISKLPVQQDELPPPPSSVRGATMNSRGHVSVNFNLPPSSTEVGPHNPKHLHSSSTWEESESSSNPDSDDVSELENTTITGSKTWVTLRGSRKAKIALLALSFALVLMIGLLVGQSAQRKAAEVAQLQQQQQQQQQGQEQTLVGSTGAPYAAPTAPTTETSEEAPTVTSRPDPLTTDPTAAPVVVDQDPNTAANEDVVTPSTQGYDYTANSDYLVGVYYYPWHGTKPIPFHNGDGYMRKELSPQHQPALGEYDDSDPAVIAQHMAWFRQANIGLLVTSWWGPNRVEDMITKDVIMEHEDVGNLKIALHYETTGRLGDGRERIANAKTDIEYMCEHYFDHPNYYKIDGRPVVFIYVSRKLETVGTLEEALLTMRSTANKCGSSLYLI
ncbi:MAG: hypothetical protein SGILL_002540, partial [Bacillariaceae sp.]